MAQVFVGKSGSNIRWQLAQILVDIYTPRVEQPMPCFLKNVSFFY